MSPRRKSRRLKGGLKLRDNQKHHFAPIIDMMNSPSGQIQLLTFSSLKGFMISLNVAPENSEYLGLSDKFQFTRPVTSFILKFAVITPHNDTSLPDYKGVEKASESAESYFDEAKLQQNIWKRSIVGGRPEVCPPVANFSLFDQSASMSLCSFFSSKAQGDPRITDMFLYLSNVVSNNPLFGLGVIVMPKVEMSSTFGDIIYSKPGKTFFNMPIDNQLKENAYIVVTAQVLRLFIDVGVIHFDLHTGNSLVFVKPDGSLGAVIIDFGRASNVLDPAPNEFMNMADKQQWTAIKAEAWRLLLTIDINASDVVKKNFVIRVMNQLADFEHAKFQKLFNPTDKGRYQMDWYEYFPTNTQAPVQVFDLLKAGVVVRDMRIQGSTIQNYENKGNLLSFNQPINSYLVPNASLPQLPPLYVAPAQAPAQAPMPQTPPLVPQSMPDPHCQSEMPGMCAISGGKRKHKRTHFRRKPRKFRKTRKTRRHQSY